VLFGGPQLVVLLVLALGAAMAVGSLLALIRPPEGRGDGDLERAPVARSIAMIAVGALASVWAIGSLVAG
jgi:hypothetical protein